MVKDRVLELFKDCPRAVQRVVMEVIRLEQEHISMKRPRVKEEIRQIIDRAVQDET